MDIQLLITFTKLSKLDDTIENITSSYVLAFNKIYVLENSEDNNELICSYNIDLNYDIHDPIPMNTISVHRKKDSNTLYTINALNYLIELLNDGKLDTTFSVPWKNYKNMLLITNGNELKKIETKIHSIISL